MNVWKRLRRSIKVVQTHGAISLFEAISPPGNLALELAMLIDTRGVLSSQICSLEIGARIKAVAPTI
jgi:hypothetical protein